MAAGRERYRRLTELYVEGGECVFKDGTVMWLQVPNPFEVQECRNDSQTGRSRVIMALKDEDSAEWAQTKAHYLEYGKDLVIEELISSRYAEFFMRANNFIDSDPEWKERMSIMRTSDQPPAVPLTTEEQALLEKLNQDYFEEIQRRVNDEGESYRRMIGLMSDDELLEEYRERWIERRGSAIALAEYQLSQLFYGCRVCEAKLPEGGGEFTPASHKECDHSQRAFETRQEIRDLPEGMFNPLRELMDNLTMSVRDAKNSDRQGSSSDSSPLPSEVEASTVSIPEEIPVPAHGT